MNDYQQNLYNDLMSLVASNEAFYFQDFNLDDSMYRIFNYRLASYTDFLLPGALECRGTMFEVQGNQAVRLAALPMEKFFNLNENPLTTNLDLTSVVEIQEKVDGSLISTYVHNGKLYMKSKGSLFSDQAAAAMKWLEQKKEMYDALFLLAELSFTVNLEWCSPDNRIVLGYAESTLKVLNIRNALNGQYVDGWMPTILELSKYVVESVKTDDPVAFVASIPAMQNVEGFVVRLASGQRIKVKCDWYLSLHHVKDSINNPRRLFEVILDEGIDDIRSIFCTDLVAIKLIDEMQVKVDHLYNAMVKEVESFYEANKDLSRKDYAIKGKQVITPLYFGLTMNKYIGKSMNYKSFLKSKWKELGLRDQSVVSNEE